MRALRRYTDCFNHNRTQIMEKMTSEQRRARILELQTELNRLRAEELIELGTEVDYKLVMSECRELVQKGDRVKAVNHYRLKTGSGLREAYDVMQQFA
ncbi:hypothetical protein WJ96_05725 [Burkholderia ubonensis]|uniref:Ribosomal protein L7/L12 C-terminal domain-containing protein n=2 Tax=Burkholderia ubonensis TaxID=101571 RepID=A0AAW3MVV1_9BURK|nr:hypothetical protein WJ97_12655 [Burkholderia ubonensis]KVP98068.1 hypothetical protein WJ96_05725 [Burkholderia ubonensis]KVZ92765.1 hypothetical protein WL25_17385 [Burkholderia ubonensis]